MMRNSVQREALLQKRGTRDRRHEALVVERPLQLIVNGDPFSITMQTPGDERYLTRGLLHAEGATNSAFIVFGLEEEERATIARVEIECDDVLTERRRLAATSSCGLCGKETLERLFDGLEPVEKQVVVPFATIRGIYREIEGRDTLFGQTGGCHAASAATCDGELLCLFEDIGRHNAVDKVIGWLLEHDRLSDADVLTVSGRVSYEILQKCTRAGIPVLAAISAPSALAVDIAEAYGVTLAAFCREDRVTLYANPERISQMEKEETHHV